LMLVQASERRRGRRQAEADDGEDFIEPLEKARRHARRFSLEASG